MKLFVWDLHGTMEQGNDAAVIEVLNKVLENHGYPARFGSSHAFELYGRKWHEYFAHILPAEKPETHVGLQAATFAYFFSDNDDGIKIMNKHVKPSKNLEATLDAIGKEHEQILISNTIPEGMRLFIHMLGLSKYFNETNAFPVDEHMSHVRGVKKDILANYLAVRPEYDEVIVIGDSETDMELAEAFDAKAYLYAHEGTPFRSQKGHFKINDLKEVLREL